MFENSPNNAQRRKTSLKLAVVLVRIYLLVIIRDAL